MEEIQASLAEIYSDLQAASPPEAVPTPADIPGADLEEPFQAHTVAASLWALSWVNKPPSWRKIHCFGSLHFRLGTSQMVISAGIE